MQKVHLLALFSSVLLITSFSPAQTATGETLMLDLPRASQRALIMDAISATSQGTVMLALATVHVIVSTVWLVTWSHLLRRGRHRLDTPRVRAAIDRAAGAVLIALGVRAGAQAVRP